jgi:alpha-methylacyl-CoA racemase
MTIEAAIASDDRFEAAGQKGRPVSYQPLHGVKVLDLGILIPPALASNKLVALGADVVKVEQRGRGDRIRAVPPLADDGRSSQHMGYDWGKRSIALDVRDDEDRATVLRLADAADVIMENQLAGSWARFGIDFAEMCARRPELIVCSLTGFGQTGPLSALPSHGLNMDALADSIIVEWLAGEPHLGWTFTSWGNELGAANAAMAVCAAIANVRAGGEGAWIDMSCWDALVEAHRTDIIVTVKTGVTQNSHERVHGPLYDTYLSKDGKGRIAGRAGAEVLGQLLPRGRSDRPDRRPQRHRDRHGLGQPGAARRAASDLRRCLGRGVGPPIRRVGLPRLHCPAGARRDGSSPF